LILLSVEVSYFVFLVEVGLLNCINCQFHAEPRNHLHEALLNSGLASADSGLQLDLGDRVKRCLSEDPAPAAYSAGAED
jgi:hypothetical protein